MQTIYDLASTNLKKSETFDFTSNSIYGNQDASWISFYDFFMEETDVDGLDKLKPLRELCHLSGWCITQNDIVFVSEKPKELHMEDGRLHNPEGPAILYDDGFSVYALNGVSLRGVEHLMDRNADPKAIINVDNVQQRAELINWYGIEKLFEHLKPKLIDTWNDYELYKLNVYEDIDRVYLKMKNPSEDLIHIEPVPQECRTCKDALKWREKLPDDEEYVEPVVRT